MDDYHEHEHNNAEIDEEEAHYPGENGDHDGDGPVSIFDLPVKRTYRPRMPQ